MTTEQKAPFVAFLVVAAVCVLVVAHGMGGLLPGRDDMVSTEQKVLPGVRLSRAPLPDPPARQQQRPDKAKRAADSDARPDVDPPSARELFGDLSDYDPRNAAPEMVAREYLRTQSDRREWWERTRSSDGQDGAGDSDGPSESDGTSDRERNHNRESVDDTDAGGYAEDRSYDDDRRFGNDHDDSDDGWYWRRPPREGESWYGDQSRMNGSIHARERAPRHDSDDGWTPDDDGDYWYRRD